MIPGPDFPGGGVLVEPKEQILEAYKTGRGGFRLRAKWTNEDTGRGTYQIVVTEIPYQVQKAKLVERIAELLTEKKLPLLGDVRDESAEEIRLVLEPKSRTVDPVLLMESLFRLTELEVRFGLNMNVLSARADPERAVACATCCASGSSTASTCWCSARSSACRRSSIASRCSTATSSPTSTSTR